MIRLRRLDHLLATAERSIALLDRCRPANAASELGRVTDAWNRGREIEPNLEYPPPPDLSEIARMLEAIAESGAMFGPWGSLYAARAAELFKEAQLVAAIGTREFRSLAAQRFPTTVDAATKRAAEWARRWMQAPLAGSGQCVVVSDDTNDPRSLISTVRRGVGALRLPMRIVASSSLSTVAAVGEGVIYIRTGVPLSVRDAMRIALHEIHGHAIPRVAAPRQSLGLLVVGTAGSSADEEGRALLLERRARLFGRSRRRELAERHTAALALRDGADWTEAVRRLTALGTNSSTAVATVMRVYRGGGLGREIVYLPALVRVRDAFAQSPYLEPWFERGRVSVDAAKILSKLGPQPTLITPIASPYEENVALSGA